DVSSSVLLATSRSALSTLSLHDALPILVLPRPGQVVVRGGRLAQIHPQHVLRVRVRHVYGVPLLRARQPLLHVQHAGGFVPRGQDRKSTRLNSSHEWISYAVFCLKNKTL